MVENTLGSFNSLHLEQVFLAIIYSSILSVLSVSLLAGAEFIASIADLAAVLT